MQVWGPVGPPGARFLGWLGHTGPFVAIRGEVTGLEKTPGLVEKY